MRSTFSQTVRFSAVLALVLAVSFFSAGCSSCNPCATNVCATNKCATNTCATNSCATNTCATNNCGCPPPRPVCEAPCAPRAQVQAGNCGAFPANARPGEAWCCVFIPPVYNTVSKQVCVQPETCNKVWVPPTYRTVTEQVMVEPQRVNRIPIPAVFETVSEQVCVQPEGRRQIPVPAVFQTVEDCIEVCGPRTEWQRVNCTPAQAAAGQAECWALITIPAVMERRQRQVCVTPESCREEVIPARYETVTRQVCKTPETCREEIIPARYESRERQVEETCGYHRDDVVPARYENVSEQVCVSDGRWEWQLNADCAVPMPAATNPCVPADMPR